MRLSLKSVKKPQSLARARKGVSGPFFRSGECCFHHPVKESCFYLHLSRHRVALSLFNRRIPWPSCECEASSQLSDPFPSPTSHPNCTCVFNSLTPLMSSRLSPHRMAFQLASLTALSFLWFARSVAQRSDFHIFVAFSLSWSLCLLSLPLGAYTFAIAVFNLYCHLEDVGKRAVAGDCLPQHLWSFRLVCLVRELLLREVPVLSEGTPGT